MKNILENKFWWTAKSFAAVVVFGISVATADVFITELTDPQNSSDAGRYVELYNSGSADIDLGEGWELLRWTNDNADPQSPVGLTGYIPAGGFFIICNEEGLFDQIYDFSADQDIGTGGPADSNGDDNIALLDPSGNIVDMFGVAGEDGSGTAHEFEDGRAERVATVTSGSPTWDATEWNIDNDSGGGDGPQYAPEDFDPGAWIGHEGEPLSIVGTWKLAPLAGALGVGPSPGDYSWWSSSAEDATTRACLFDDEYVFNADGSFQNVQGSETWVETWQTDVTAEGCGAPVAPHDGSNAATWSLDAAAGTITVSGLGAYVGLAKVHNGGEDGAPVDDMITYNYSLSEDGNSMDITIQGFNSGVPEAEWIFKMVNSQWEPTYEDISITFNLDMSGAESINSEGISIAGGILFGVPGENQMTDEDGDNIYTTTLTVSANSGSDYTFINGVSDWGQKENIAGQECAVDPYNDRTIEWGTEDIVVNACFGICGDGICADLIPPTTVLVHFNVYAPGGPETVWATGSFEGWSGYGVAMTDPDGNGIYNGTIELSENFGDVEYKYTYGGWDVQTGATTGDWCDWYPDDSWDNFGFSVEEHDVYLPIFIWGGGCGEWYSDMAGRPWMIANEPGAIAVGPSMGSGEWWSNDEASLTDRACYFDDRYYFTWNGEFHNDFRGDTWLETWQDGVDAEGCGAPVAPHDNSNPASYSFDAEAGTITLHGAGAFLGLPKAFNGGELSNGGTVPESVTYIVDHFDEDSAMVYIDVSENETGGSWWTYTMVREPAPTMVTFWLDAYDVPCDGSPYLAGSFNGWNATDIEMTYDEEWDEYYADVYLMPGYYEYKFTCFDWSASENIPAECSDPNDDGYSNRYVEVPELDVEDWYEVDVVGWGECPDPEPCELVEDCGNLSLVFIMEEPFIQQITDTLLYYMDISADSAYSYIAGGNVNMEVHNFYNSEGSLNTFSAEFIPEVSSPEDSVFIYLAEIPGGFPDSVFSYYWVASTVGGFLGEYFEGECTDYNEAWNMETRYWDPADWEEELGLLAMGDEDLDPPDIWNFDNWNSCDYYFTVDPGDWTYIGNFEGHDYYQVNDFVHWDEAHDIAADAGGYLATITSPEENDFLYNAIDWGVNSEMYMGLYDETYDGQGWTWVTGEPFIYQNWDENQPDSPGSQNWGVIWENNGGKWDDGNADIPFIVEFGDVEEPEEFVGLVTACDPWHYENGYADNFFGVDPWVEGLINSGDILTITQGDQTHSFTVNNITHTNIESCVDEYGDYLNAYVVVDGDFSDTFGEYLMVGSTFINESLVTGCTDPMAQNYNPDALWDNGSCDYSEPELTITSYTYSVQTLDSYNNGDYATTVLPNVDVNDGLHTIAYFDTVGIEGPYAGLYTLFFDSNFNGQLDSTDFNMLSWSDFGNDENVLLLVDNGPDDMNPDVGVYETITHADSDEGGFIRVQGADYFMIAITPDYTISGYTTVTPVSGSTNRVTGTGTMPDPDTGELVGVPNMWVSMWDWYYGDLVGMGITGPDGTYDIGIDINDYTDVWITVDENYNMTNRYFGVFENGGPGGYGGTWIQATLGLDGTVQDFDVIKLNTLVHGQVTAPDGSPVAGANIDISWTYAGDYYGYYNSSLWSYTDTDDYGYYSFWAMNGESVNISVWSQYEDYHEEVNIFSETYDEYLDGFFFNHDIMLMDPPDLPQTELLDNNSFEDYYYDYYTGLNHAEQWWNFPWDGNFHVAQTGEGIYGSEETFTAFDGEASLKMWGQYNGDGADNTTDYYQGFHQQIDPGAVINAGAMMMSHPGDWIGGGSGLNNGQVFVSYFDYDWNFLGMDVSEPMDTSYAAGEWHYMSVISEVPDGTNNVNIGVRYNQVYGSDGSEGHGSIYYDNVQAYTSASDVHTVQVYGMTEQPEIDEYGEHIGSASLPNATVYVWNENYFIEVMSDDYGWWFADVPVNQTYYVTGGDVEGFYESSFEEIFACDDYYYDYYDYCYYYDCNDCYDYCYYDEYGYEYCYEYCYDDYYYDYCDNQVNVYFTPNAEMWFDVQGQVTDASGNAVYDAQVRLNNHDTGQNYYSGTDYMGYFSVHVPYGMYDARVNMSGYMITHEYGVEVMSDGIFLSLTLEAAELTGAVEGLVIFHGNPPEDPAGVWMWSDDYAGGGTANENGFYSVPLPDGIYNIWVGAPNYEGFYQENAFEIAGNTVIFNVELYEHGFAGAPQIVDLHDIPNDQGRQMRSVWSPGIPGNWEYFTQYSIWRKVNGAPVELWDYVETVPWHGMDEPYAAVVATLGDSSMHGIYESTFMVTAHTEDINIWFDSQPVSGYSIDNLHPGTPMSLVYSHDPGAVSLSWSGPEDEDFSHHNIYRQDIASSDPAIVFTTVDSFYVDLDVTDVGAYQYWVTAVDLSGLESETSNSVSAVLSADENLGLPTEFALKQNYPNPFNPSTQIQYALPEETRVVISIYDLMGRKVRTLVNDVQDAGYRTVIWNSTNNMGRLVSAGVYIYSIQAGDFVQNRKMVLMK